jgi:hypothetical protein
MEVTKQRALGSLSILESVELGKERIRQFAGFGRCDCASKNYSRGRAEISAIYRDKMFPRFWAAFGAGDG